MLFIIKTNKTYKNLTGIAKIKYTSIEVDTIEKAEEIGANFPYSERWHGLPQEYKIAYFERQKWVKEGKQAPEPARMPISTILETIPEDSEEEDSNNVRASLIAFEELEGQLEAEFRKEKEEQAKREAQTKNSPQPSRIPTLKSTPSTVTSALLSLLRKSCSAVSLNGQQKNRLNHPGADLDQTYKVDTRWTDPKSPVVQSKPSLLFKGSKPNGSASVPSSPVSTRRNPYAIFKGSKSNGSTSVPSSPVPNRKIPILIRK